MKLLTVIGARPQFIKAAVLSRYLRDNKSLGIQEILVHTGQHYDANMSEVFFKEMDIPSPQYNLHLGSGSHGKMTGAMLSGIEELCFENKPDVLLVYGDTNSTLAGALAASKLNIPVAHVEAGLRSYMMAMPEEQNRRLTDNLASWLFCPTQIAVDNLKKEGIFNTPHSEVPSHSKYSADCKCVTLTGDIMYDAFLYYSSKNTIQINEKNFILVTIHRAENTDNFEKLSSIINALNSLKNFNFILPLHPRTKKILSEQKLALKKHIKVIEPVGYLEMIEYEKNCDAILTDSGGVQKEAFFIHKPCITMRDSTEWIELVTSGWNTLTGSDTKKIIQAVQLLNIPSTHPNLYGDGNCVTKIVNTLLKTSNWRNI